MAQEWLKVLAGVRATRRALRPGEALFHAGDRADAIFEIVSGSVRLVRHSGDGGTVTLHRAQRGSLFAEAALFSEAYHCDAVADEAAQVAIYPKRALLLHLRAHPDLMLALTAYLARQLQALRGRLELVRLKTARERVLAFLAQLGPDGDGVVAVDRPLTVVASEIGLTHEALYRTLARLQRTGEVERVGKRSFRLR